LLGKGSHEVELERLIPGQPARGATVRPNAPPQEAPAAPEIAALMLDERSAQTGEAQAGPAAPDGAPQQRRPASTCSWEPIAAPTRRPKRAPSCWRPA